MVVSFCVRLIGECGARSSLSCTDKPMYAVLCVHLKYIIWYAALLTKVVDLVRTKSVLYEAKKKKKKKEDKLVKM